MVDCVALFDTTSINETLSLTGWRETLRLQLLTFNNWKPPSTDVSRKSTGPLNQTIPFAIMAIVTLSLRSGLYVIRAAALRPSGVWEGPKGTTCSPRTCPTVYFVRPGSELFGADRLQRREHRGDYHIQHRVPIYGVPSSAFSMRAVSGLRAA